MRLSRKSSILKWSKSSIIALCSKSAYGDPPPPPVSLNCPTADAKVDAKLVEVTQESPDFCWGGCWPGAGGTDGPWPGGLGCGDLGCSPPSGGAPPEGSYLRGRPLERWRLFMNSASSTIQKDPKSSSYLTKHLCNDKLVRIAFYSVFLREVDDRYSRRRRKEIVKG